MNAVEIQIQSPTPFMIRHREKLLPDWKIPPQTLVFVLLEADFSLDGEGHWIEREKERLLQQFLYLGQSFYLASQQLRYSSEIISPQDGTPQYSKRGKFTFDIVAAVHHSLSIEYSRTAKGCKVLSHPVWKAAVYPGIFLSEASNIAVEAISNEIIDRCPSIQEIQRTS
jgi:hypothetical protein